MVPIPTPNNKEIKLLRNKLKNEKNKYVLFELDMLT